MSDSRTYLWVSLVVDVLDRNFKDTPEEWGKLIKNPPTTVFRAYESLLSHIDVEYVGQVKLLLDLIIAAERPLTLREMNIAIEIRDRTDISSEGELDLSSDENFRKWLIHTCGFFVTEYDGKVSFIHQTAKEFLLQKFDVGAIATNRSSHNSTWRHSVTLPQAHRSMAESCIAYLSLGSFSDNHFRRHFTEYCLKSHYILNKKSTTSFNEIISPFKGLGFFNYVIRFWLGHFRLAQEKDPRGDIRDVAPKFESRYFSLFDDEPPISMPWLVIAAASPNEICSYDLIGTDWYHKPLHDLRPHLIRSVTIASMAALFGHVRLLQRVFDHVNITPDLTDNTHEHDERTSVSSFESYYAKRYSIL